MSSLSQYGRLLGAQLDSRLAAWAKPKPGKHGIAGLQPRMVDTRAGRIRVVDSASDKPCVMLTPDGPNVIEHYEELIERLSRDLRVVCFDMPGFGFSTASPDYCHTLDQASAGLIELLDVLGVSRATLAFTCANGLYALRMARIAPERVTSLFLSQTPSLDAMGAWAKRIVASPLHVPVIGQTAVWLAREKLAMGWYGRALARGRDRELFRAPARAALSRGAAFSLAGVVQGLTGESQAKVENVDTPCAVLWGMQDRSHQQTEPEAIRACVPAAEVTRCAEAGHFPDLEEPERYGALLVAHVARYGAAR
jgi:pimeloyl-ACP methyl ester carboxylesterase